MNTDWILFYLIPVLLTVAIAGGAVIKAKTNKQIKWYYSLILNFTVGLLFAMGVAIPLGAIYLIFFQKKADDKK